MGTGSEADTTNHTARPEVLQIAPRDDGTLRNAGRWLVGFCRKKPLGALGLVIVLALAVCAIGAPWIAPFGQDEQNLVNRMSGPSAEHWIGTDHLGRDVFSRIVYGARAALIVGFGASLLAQVVALILAIPSGYIGGALDKMVQRVVDIWMALPGLVLLITLLSMLGAGMISLVLVLGFLYAGRTSRIFRSMVLSIREQAYIEAARASGATSCRIMLQHVLPNLMHIVILTATLSLGTVILAEATVSFLGYGIQPPTPSWGQMLGVEGRSYMLRYPGLAIFPGIAIAIAVFGFNILGDALRDVLDPRQRGAG